MEKRMEKSGEKTMFFFLICSNYYTKHTLIDWGCNEKTRREWILCSFIFYFLWRCMCVDFAGWDSVSIQANHSCPLVLAREWRKERAVFSRQWASIMFRSEPRKIFGPWCSNIGPTSGQFQCSEPSMEGWFSSLSLSLSQLLRNN
jgi:hypothetical protein